MTLYMPPESTMELIENLLDDVKDAMADIDSGHYDAAKDTLSMSREDILVWLDDHKPSKKKHSKPIHSNKYSKKYLKDDESVADTEEFVTAIKPKKLKKKDDVAFEAVPYSGDDMGSSDTESEYGEYSPKSKKKSSNKAMKVKSKSKSKSKYKPNPKSTQMKSLPDSKTKRKSKPKYKDFHIPKPKTEDYETIIL